MKTKTPPSSSASHGTRGGEDARTERLFASLDREGTGRITRATFEAALRAQGLELGDPRLSGTIRALETLDPAAPLGVLEFGEVIGPNVVLIERALTGGLALPEFGAFAAQTSDLFEASRSNTTGKVADYIPQLAQVAPEQFGLAVCSADGQRLDLGDANTEFCVQSCCKPLNYCLALEELGEERVHAHVGCEPSGQKFNELTLNPAGMPHNPLINAGAIMSCALIRADASAAERFDHVQTTWQRACGGVKPGFSNPTYLSERKTADRNFALGYFMRESGSFPQDADLVSTLEFYFQCCSLESTARSMSVFAATLASGGICPVTGERVFRSETVRRCLSLMDSCGMYDFSGQWAFSVGLPAKSGVSGAILIVVPNLLGVCVWSPRLDVHGNSVRGIDFARRLTQRFSLHNYDILAGGAGPKLDPRRRADERTCSDSGALCLAASKGDLSGLQQLVARGVDLDQADYDGRTAMHLAASEGQVDAVGFLVAQGVGLDPIDRWGGTPLDDAQRGGHAAVEDLLLAATAASAAADARES